MSEKNIGLIYPDGHEASTEEVRRKRLVEDLVDGEQAKVTFSESGAPRTFSEWTDIMVRRQHEYQELLATPESETIKIDTKEPLAIWLVADTHSGGEEIDYERQASDVEIAKRMGAKVITVGDLTDSCFWSSFNQIARHDEQMLFMQAMMDEVDILAGWGGDHDMWAHDKHGMHTLYQSFKEKHGGAPYFDGVSYLSLELNNGEGEPVNYGLVGSHRHKGFSVYNDAHASLRQFRDEGVGALISFTAHNHVKAALTQVHKVHGGDEVKFHSLALGTYKKTDRYSRKMGWPRKGKESAGGFGIVLSPDKEDVRVFWTLEDTEEYVTLLKQLK